jgi:hypothetical protein
MGGWPFRGAARWTCQIRLEPADQAGPCPFVLLIIKKTEHGGAGHVSKEEAKLFFVLLV